MCWWGVFPEQVCLTLDFLFNTHSLVHMEAPPTLSESVKNFVHDLASLYMSLKQMTNFRSKKKKVLNETTHKNVINIYTSLQKTRRFTGYWWDKTWHCLSQWVNMVTPFFFSFFFPPPFPLKVFLPLPDGRLNVDVALQQ